MHNGSLDTQTAYPNWRTRIIALLTNFVTRAPKTVVICAVLLSLISAWYAAKNLTLDANTDSLISPDRPFMQKYTAYCKEFGDLEYLYVAVDAKGNPTAANHYRLGRTSHEVGQQRDDSRSPVWICRLGIERTVMHEGS